MRKTILSAVLLSFLWLSGMAQLFEIPASVNPKSAGVSLSAGSFANPLKPHFGLQAELMWGHLGLNAGIQLCHFKSETYPEDITAFTRISHSGNLLNSNPISYGFFYNKNQLDFYYAHLIYRLKEGESTFNPTIEIGPTYVYSLNYVFTETAYGHSHTASEMNGIGLDIRPRLDLRASPRTTLSFAGIASITNIGNYFGAEMRILLVTDLKRS